MKEIRQQSIMTGTIKGFVLALLSTLLVSDALTQWAIQRLEPVPQWGEYLLFSTLLLCLAAPGFYFFRGRPMAFLIDKSVKAERSEPITS